MKRPLAIFFLAIFLLNLAGTYFYFGMRLFQIRREMRTELKLKEVSELECIVLTANEYRKVRVGDDEMKWKGKMYDISRTQRRGDQIIVYCLHDENEDNLLVLLNSILKNASKDKKPVPSSLLGFLNLAVPSSFDIRLAKFFHKESHYTRYQFSNEELQKMILAPPPKG